MNQERENTELQSLNAIRIETVISRFPVHRLAKRGRISIDIRETTETGEVKTKWEVSYNSKYGQPSPLAYKVDSLVINRRIEEAPRPVPKVIKLGSLRDICRELDLNEGQATRNVKKALLQNASAFITAKRSYKGSDGTEITAEISDTRYGVIFRGEKFPEGGRADAVYIQLWLFISVFVETNLGMMPTIICSLLCNITSFMIDQFLMAGWLVFFSAMGRLLQV